MIGNLCQVASCESYMERLIDEYVEGQCMSCKKHVDYELICVSPDGMGPVVCEECLGI